MERKENNTEKKKIFLIEKKANEKQQKEFLLSLFS